MAFVISGDSWVVWFDWLRWVCLGDLPFRWVFCFNTLWIDFGLIVCGLRVCYLVGFVLGL